jgi:hypothetical protein
MFRKDNDMLHPFMAGSGKNTNKAMFSIISKYLSLQCNKTGFENNDLAHLKNDSFCEVN